MVTYDESTYGDTFGSTWLGRPYSSYSTTVFKNSFLDRHISKDGWTIWSTGSPQTSNVIFGEFNNTGPGSWQADSTRPSFATKMTLDQVAPYSLANWVGDTSFIDQKAWNYPPPFDANTTSTPDTTGTPTTGSGSTSTASVNAHPEDGKVPPQYAIVVSQSGEGNASFSNISAALASMPNDNTNQTIFIFSGNLSIYELQQWLTIADKIQAHITSSFLRSIVRAQFVSLVTPRGLLASPSRTTR